MSAARVSPSVANPMTPATLCNLLSRLDRPRVAVLRALKLGDLLCAVPALRALRSGLPRAEIVLVGLPWARALVERYPHYLDGFREFPGYPGLPERPVDVERVPAFLAEMQSERFDLALQLHGSGSFVNSLVALWGARHMAGFFVPGDYCPDAETFLSYPDEGLEVRRLNKLVQFLGFPDAGEELEFPLGEADFQAMRAIPEASALAGRSYVCLHPGASVPERRWPVEGFIEVAGALAEMGQAIVLTGSAEEAELTRKIASSSRAACADLAGRTGLGALAAVVSAARLLVCNDTGVSHIAAALRVPSVVISTGSNPARWAPTDAVLHHVLGPAERVTAAEVCRHAQLLLRGQLLRGQRLRPAAVLAAEAESA